MKKQETFVKFAWAVLALTVGVIVWGAYVRVSGSGNGCGSHWPTCDGDIVPKTWGVKKLIEFSHRASSGLLLIVVVLEVWFARRVFAPGHPARAAAWAVGALIVTEALVGATLVLFEYVAENKSVARAAWVATHLGNTFLLLAAMSLTAYFAGGAPVPTVLAQGSPYRQGARPPAPATGGVAGLVALALAGTLVVAAVGAVTALGDTLFPAADLAAGLRQDAAPAAHFLIRLRAVHPALAVVVFVYVISVASHVAAKRASPRVRRLHRALVVAFVAQVAGGVVNLALAAPAAMQLVHLVLADVAWVTLVLFAACALAEPAGAAAPITLGGGTGMPGAGRA